MYSVKPMITDVQSKIKPADIMYHVERIFKGSLSADQVATGSGDIVKQLTNLESKIVGGLGKFDLGITDHDCLWIPMLPMVHHVWK